MTSSRSLQAGCLPLLVFACTAWAQTDALRQSWLQARDAIVDAGAQLPAQRRLRRYALYPYLQAADITNRLRTPESYAQAIVDAGAFVDEHDDSAIADTFRRELLLALSDLGAWEEFVAFYRSDVANESRECEYLRARVELGLTEGLQALVAQRWLTPRRLTSACEPAFAWLRQTGVLDYALTAQRLEMLLDNGETQFARIIAGRLPDEQAETFKQWAWMLEHPLEALDRIAAGRLVPAHPDAIVSVWKRVSVQSPQDALQRFDGLSAAVDTDGAVAREMLRDLALGLAWDRNPQALNVFARLLPAEHDDYTRSWLARSALWSAQWEMAYAALAAMSSSARDESAWVYWRARAARQLSREAESEALYASLLERDNFYSAMAAARLGRPVTPNEEPQAARQESIQELSGRIEFVRAGELFHVGERIAATREWRYATRDLDTEGLIAAMHLAAGWGWHDMAVATATRAEVFFDYRLLYPLPYRSEIRAAAAAHRLDDALLGGLIRQESLFRPDAVSGAGAIGLTQLRPSTAASVADSAGIARPSRTQLLDPAANTRLGAAVLRRGLERFDGQLFVALAAYNAGPAAAQRWLPQRRVDGDIWVENIPYNETREYVRRVLWNSIVYAWMLDDYAPVDAMHLLSTIPAYAEQAGPR